MTRRLLLSYLTITTFALAVLVVPLGVTFAGRERERLVAAIERDATAVASLAEDSLEGGRPMGDLRAVLDRYASGGGRVVVVDRDGISVEDSDAPGGEPRDFSTRPEVRAALAGQRADGIRPSETLGHALLYVAVPVASGGTVHGAVRVSFPTSKLDARVRANWIRLGALAAVVLASVAGVGLVLARSVIGPVRRLEAVSHRLASGDLSARVPTDDGPPELRALAASFNAMADRVGHLIGAHRRFVGDASHQLRTPLTALQLQLETLAESLPDRSVAKVSAALAETERLGRLVESLLVLARADAGPTATAAVDLCSIVRERVSVWQPVAAAHGVRLRADLPVGAPVWSAPGALDQVLDNLLSNAIDASSDGGVVRMAVRTATEAVELRVSDQGPGMTDEQRARAFDRFWRAPGASKKGFGLGLAIVRELVTASGGEVRLEPGGGGRGLDAVVVLPAASPRVGPVQRPAAGAA